MAIRPEIENAGAVLSDLAPRCWSVHMEVRSSNGKWIVRLDATEVTVFCRGTNGSDVVYSTHRYDSIADAVTAAESILCRVESWTLP